MIRKYFFPVLLFFVCVGFLLRFEVCRELLVSDVQVSNPSRYTDMATYKELSEKVAKGEFKGEFYYQPFYYAVFLPVIKKLLGTGVWPVLLAQCLLSVLTIWLSAVCASRIWGRMAGLITVFLMVFSKALILYTPYHLIATLQAFWMVLILFLSINTIRGYYGRHGSDKNRKYYQWALLGFVVSLAILTRGNIWFFVPGLFFSALWMGFKKEEKVKTKQDKKISFFRSSLPAVLFLLMVIIPQIPFAWRNTKITGRLSGPSTASGAVLSLGNSPEAPPGGRNPGTGPGPMEYPRTYQAWMAQMDKVPVCRRIWDWFCTEPFAFIELQCRKLLLFWDYREIPNNIAFEYQGEKSFTLRYLGFVSTSLIMVFAIGGIFLFLLSALFHRNAGMRLRQVQRSILKFKSFTAHPSRFILLYLILAYWLATSAFYLLARFRVPAIPLFAVLAGGFVDYGIKNFLNRSWNLLSRHFLPVLITALFIVYAAYDTYRFNCEAAVMRLVRPSGVISKLEDDTILYLDNGPITFGSWDLTELKERTVITKNFVVGNSDMPRSLTGAAKLVLPLLWQTPGTARLNVNGNNIELKGRRPGLVEHEFYIAFRQDGRIRMEVLFLDCEISYFLDYQRYYGRTTVSGKNPGGELVCSLYLMKQKTEK